MIKYLEGAHSPPGDVSKEELFFPYLLCLSSSAAIYWFTHRGMTPPPPPPLLPSHPPIPHRPLSETVPTISYSFVAQMNPFSSPLILSLVLTSVGLNDNSPLYSLLEHLRAQFHSCMSDPLISAYSLTCFQNSSPLFSMLPLPKPRQLSGCQQVVNMVIRREEA